MLKGIVGCVEALRRGGIPSLVGARGISVQYFSYRLVRHQCKISTHNRALKVWERRPIVLTRGRGMPKGGGAPQRPCPPRSIISDSVREPTEEYDNGRPRVVGRGQH